MPKISLTKKWPEEVETAIKIYSNRTGLEILLYLQENGPCTFGPIFENVTDRTRMQVGRTLNTLEDLGVVEVNLPRGQRQYKQPKYDINHDALVKMGHSLVEMFSKKGQKSTVSAGQAPTNSPRRTK
jgi:DNA-binding transcriptional ArsR family regulator